MLKTISQGLLLQNHVYTIVYVLATPQDSGFQFRETGTGEHFDTTLSRNSEWNKNHIYTLHKQITDEEREREWQRPRNIKLIF